MKLTDDDILSECRYQSSQASGSEYAADELVADRTKALEYYLGKARGDEIEGRSKVISMDIADMIDAMLSQIMPSFQQDNLVQFEAVSEADESQARIESSFCNYVVMERNKGFILFETMLKDALLSKNSTTKVRVDVKQNVEVEKYKDLTDEEMFIVLQPTGPNQEVITTRFEEKKGNLNLKRITTTRKLIVEAVAPENFSITSEHKSPYLDDCNYCVERYWTTKSQLIEEGYDRAAIEALPPSTSDTKIDSIARNQIDDEQNHFNTEKSMQIVEIEEHYIRIDKDDDGIAELLKVRTCENNILTLKGGKSDITEVDHVPYANGVVYLMGHRFYGLSVYDKLKNVQDIKTHFLRQWSDNALVNNHNKTDVVEDQVNMEDFTNGRPNAIRRMDSLDSARDIVPHDIGPSCQLALNYWDKVRTERTGSSLDMQSNQMAMPSNVGDQGVNTLVANLEQVTALITRNFTETAIHSTYSLVHKFLKAYFPEEMNAKMGGQWQNTNPSQWLDREQVNVILPPTRSEKIVQQIALEKAIIQAGGELAQGKGGITTDESKLYQMKIDHMRLSGIDNPEKYLIDPSTPESQQAAQMAQQAQQQAAEEEKQYNRYLQDKQLKIAEGEVQRNWENDKEQLQLDNTKLREELTFKYEELYKKLGMDKYQTDVKAEVDEAKIVGGATQALEIESMRQMGNERGENEREETDEGES